MKTSAIVGVIAVVLFVAIVVFTLVRKSSKNVAGKPELPAKQAEASIAQPVDAPNSQITDPKVSDSQVTTVEVGVPEIITSVVAEPKGFGKSQGSLTGAFRALFAREQLDDDAWQDLEDTLIMADMGVRAAGEIVAALRSKVRSQAVTDSDALFELARAELNQLVDAGLDRTLKTQRHQDGPAVVLTVGVNGTGKTTTTGKIAKLLVGQDKDVLLGAADTFRAAASDQLVTWGDRVGATVIRGAEGSDPAAVAFEAVAAGYDQEVDVVLIDTAGRLHTKQGLMDELGKVFRVASKRGPIDEVLLVIDATTGQNGLNQAKVFSEVVPITGVVLSKLDGTAKGGIVVAVQQELGVPVKLVGLGEGADDLAVFNPSEFVAGLLA
jgi:fused signal recognition particle receptor